MKTIEFTKTGDLYECSCTDMGTVFDICKLDHSGTYVPIADVERLRRALEGLLTYDAHSYTEALNNARKALGWQP